MKHLIERLDGLIEDDVSPTRNVSTNKLLKRGVKALDKTPSGRSSGDKGSTGGKYASIDFSPPSSVQQAAKKGLNLRRRRESLAKKGEIGKSESLGGTDIGVARGLQLSRGTALSPRAVKRMANYFGRHAKDSSAKGWNDDDVPSPGYVAHMLWGGNPGQKWANSIVDQMEKADKKEV